MTHGDKVVLVDDNWPPNMEASYDHWPKKGPAYVVRDVFVGTNMDALTMDMRREDCLAITLIGVVNPKPPYVGAHERGFAARRFRKIEEKSVVKSEAVSASI